MTSFRIFLVAGIFLLGALSFSSSWNNKQNENAMGKYEGLETILKNNYETTGLQIIKGREVVFEYGNLSQVSYIASCRKSVLSILYGKYVENGRIDLNETIGQIGIDEDDGLLEIEKSAKVDDIITSRSGVFHIPANGGYDEGNILKRGSVKPGEYFVYNNWDFNVAGEILELAAGKSVYEDLEEQLAIPLEFEDWDIKKQKKKHSPKKSRFPAYHIYISTRDMAKIGQLMLNKGKYKGRQIISSAWIDQITKEVTPTEIVNERFGRSETSDIQQSYSYMWWLFTNFYGNKNLEGAYTASGWGGQFITVIPKLDMVIAHKTKVPRLVLWGLKKGGVGNYQYYEILKKIIDAS